MLYDLLEILFPLGFVLGWPALGGWILPVIGLVAMALYDHLESPW